MIYALLARFGGYVALALVIAMLYAGLRLEHARAEAAALQAETLGASLAAHIQNADAVSAIMAAAMENERKLRVRVGSLSEEVRRAKVTVSKECHPILVPLERSLDGVRSLRGERGAAASRSSLRGRSRAAADG